MQLLDFAYVWLLKSFSNDFSLDIIPSLPLQEAGILQCLYLNLTVRSLLIILHWDWETVTVLFGEFLSQLAL